MDSETRKDEDDKLRELVGRAFLASGGIAFLVAAVVVRSMLPAKGTKGLTVFLEIMIDISDAMIGLGLGICAMALLIWFAAPLVAPNLRWARGVVARAERGEAISEAEGRLAAGVLQGAAFRILAAMLPLTMFGLWL